MNTSKPPGWKFADPPATLGEFVEWLAIRTAWVHSFLVQEFSEPFAIEIVRELGNESTMGPPPSAPNDVEWAHLRAWEYTFRLVANVHHWLDRHQVHGQPVWY